jgi:tetrahydromethanopterin S-methyltransferase subunit G
MAIVEDPDNGEPTGRTNMLRVQADAIAKLKEQNEALRAMVEQRNSDAGFGDVVRRGRKAIGIVVGIVVAVVAVLGYFETRTAQTIKSAQAEERLQTIEIAKTMAQSQVSAGNFAPMTTVAVQEQRLTTIDRRLENMDAKLDAVLDELRRRRR